jgi:hypothetical protein
MARKRTTEDLAGDVPPLTRRIIQLAKLIWGGNKSRMAKALGISHPVLSRVLRAQQEPPGKLLEALARWPGVNLRWLFAGEGEPLSDRNLWAGGGRFLPIADRLLPGAPGAHPELHTWTSLPVAEALYSQTAYWFRLPGDHPVIKAKATKVKPGDYLLVETATAWTRKRDSVRGRLCALRVNRPGGQEVILGDIDRDADPFEGYHRVETCGQFADARFLPEEAGGEDVIDLAQKVVHFRFPQVVGVCIKLDRIL